MFVVYILYSKLSDSFYIGQTIDFEKRIEEHNNHVYHKAETKKTSDWKLYFKIECTNRKQAILIEKHIKSMKSKIYLQNLKKYPEMTEKLLRKYL